MTPITELIETLERYLGCADPLEPVDALLVFGTFDLAVPRWAAAIVPTTRPSIVVVSGRRGEHTRDWPSPEHDVFASILGAPAGTTVLVEPDATNTRENVTASLALAAAAGLSPLSWGLVSRALQARRCRATFEAATSIPARSFPAPDTFRAPQYGSLEAYARRVVAELDRLEEYAASGDAVSSVRPPGVQQALDELRARTRSGTGT